MDLWRRAAAVLGRATVAVGLVLSAMMAPTFDVAALAAPANDSFASAASLSLPATTAGNTVTIPSVSGTLVGATLDAGVPPLPNANVAGGCGTASEDVWYQVQAPSVGGTLQVSVSGAGALGVAGYQGSSPSSLTVWDCLQTGGAPTPRPILIPTAASQVNYIRVYTADTVPGVPPATTFTLDITFNAPLLTAAPTQSCTPGTIAPGSTFFACWSNFISPGDGEALALTTTADPRTPVVYFQPALGLECDGICGQTSGSVALTAPATSGSYELQLLETANGFGTVNLRMQLGISAPVVIGQQTGVTDDTPPTTTATINGNPAANGSGWYVGPGATTVSLTALDGPATGASGLAATYYALDDASCAPAKLTSCSSYGQSSIPISEGSHTVYYFSVDKAGNVEPQHSLVVKVDTQRPTAQANAIVSGTSRPYLSGAWSTAPVTLQLGGTDNVGSGIVVSGIAKIYWDAPSGLNPSSPCAPATPANCPHVVGPLGPGQAVALPPFGEGQRTVVFFAQDNAGNIEQTVHTFLIWVDSTPPVTTAAGTLNGAPLPSGASVPLGSLVLVALHGTDNLSSATTLGFNNSSTPMAGVYYAWDSSTCTPATLKADPTNATSRCGVTGNGGITNITSSSLGLHTLSYFGVDFAGNIEAPAHPFTVCFAPPQSPNGCANGSNGGNGGNGGRTPPPGTPGSGTPPPGQGGPLPAGNPPGSTPPGEPYTYIGTCGSDVTTPYWLVRYQNGTTECLAPK